MNNEKVQQILNSYKNGELIKRNDKIYYNNIIGLRKANIKYVYSDYELEEYSKCYNDVCYFIEKYLNMKLFDYEKTIIEHYKNNRFQIYLGSRQMGVKKLLLILSMHDMLFNIGKKVLYCDLKKPILLERNNMFKDLYMKLPFFIQKGIVCWNKNNIKFDNESLLKFEPYKDYMNISDQYENILLNNFSYNKNMVNVYNNIVPLVNYTNNSKLIIKSLPIGNDFYYNLISGSERLESDPLKNNFKTLRTYWYEHPNRDDKWKQSIINIIGEDAFSKEYNLEFKIKKEN